MSIIDNEKAKICDTSSKCKTWVDFQDLKDDVEKQEFTAFATANDDQVEINSKQSEVFVGSLK